MMKRLVILVVVALIAWQGYARYQHNQNVKAANAAAEAEAEIPPHRVATPPQPLQRSGSTSFSFKCDGRTYCSQMTSCAEATFFLQNCPGVKMDGNNDGVPCEKQWCNP